MLKNCFNGGVGSMESVSDKTSQRDERTRFLFAERIKYVLNDPVSSLITNMALGLVLCFLLKPVFDTGRLLVWIISLFVVCMCRIMIARRYSRYRERFSPQFWFRLYFTGTELSAIVWGSTALFLFPAGFVESQVFINGNPVTGSYHRVGDADVRQSEDKVRKLMARKWAATVAKS